MKTLDQLTSRELEIELLRRKIAREAVAIDEAAADLHARRQKQFRRYRELGVQETILKLRTTDH